MQTISTLAYDEYAQNPKQEPNGTSSTMNPLERLKLFLTTTPSNWRPGDVIKRFMLTNGEQISCIYWKNIFYITGTDIVKILLYKFQLINRPIMNSKKLEEGVFSDLRNLKPGVDATLEEPRSDFLELLYRNGCIRTQKKQKVFYWYSVPHDRLFQDALERDIKREHNSINNNNFLNKNMLNPSMYINHPYFMSPYSNPYQSTSGQLSFINHLGQPLTHMNDPSDPDSSLDGYYPVSRNKGFSTNEFYPEFGQNNSMYQYEFDSLDRSLYRPKPSLSPCPVKGCNQLFQDVDHLNVHLRSHEKDCDYTYSGVLDNQDSIPIY